MIFQLKWPFIGKFPAGNANVEHITRGAAWRHALLRRILSSSTWRWLSQRENFTSRWDSTWKNVDYVDLASRNLDLISKNKECELLLFLDPMYAPWCLRRWAICWAHRTESCHWGVLAVNGVQTSCRDPALHYWTYWVRAVMITMILTKAIL